MYSSKEIRTEKVAFFSWVVCLTTSLFFLYEFIQINMFNTINPDVIRVFHVNATQLGWLSACYFFSTVFFMLPAGQILDRFSPKKVILVTLILCIIGIVGFASSRAILPAAIFRIAEGVGSAFCFLGSFRIASKWFAQERMAFVTGIIVTVGMIGGVIAQTPLTILIQTVGWRTALIYDACLGLFIALLIYLIVKDSPEENRVISIDKTNIDYWKSLRIVYLSMHNWYCGIFTCLLNLPLVLLGALWGSMYLEQAHYFSCTEASEIVSMLFIGMIIGSPIAGFISDYSGSRTIPMFVGAISSVIMSVLIIYFPINSYYCFSVIFFLTGIFSSAQILGYPAAAERNSSLLTAMSGSVVSFTTMSGYIIFQPLFGWLMDLQGKPASISDNPIYGVESYRLALFLIPFSLLISIIVVMLIKRNK